MKTGVTTRVRSYQLINYIIAGIIVMILIYSGFFSPVKNNYPVPCVHEQLTGLSCPSCGLSHSFSYIVRGNFSEASEWNIYGPRVFLFFFLQLILRVSNLFYLRQKPGDIRYLSIFDILISIFSFGVGFWQFITYNLSLFF